jgi:hypothetical protein
MAAENSNPSSGTIISAGFGVMVLSPHYRVGEMLEVAKEEESNGRWCQQGRNSSWRENHRDQETPQKLKGP